VKAACAALMLPAGMAGAGVVRAVGDCLARSDLFPIGMLPAGARDALLTLYASECASAGAPPLAAEVLASLDGVVRRGGLESPAVALTRREREVLPLLAAGGTLTEIAADLQVSPSTVRTQVAVLRAKFGAGSRSELVRKARDAGLV
jgi:DNA-binding NarL/FixJ family response regulator